MRALRTGLVAGAALAGLLIGLIGGDIGGATAATASGGAISIPLATSVRAPAGTWATVPMGHLNQPLNTFWQLFFEPAGGTGWSDRVEATAAATNGGIVLATNAKTLVVGVRPSNKLTYSPVIATSNSGRSWTTGLVQRGLASVPSALALAPDGYTMALARGTGGEGPQVIGSAPGQSALASWRQLLATRDLARQAGGASCEPAALTAVGYAGDHPVVGAECARTGTIGLFTEQTGRWTLAGPKISSAAGTAEVLSLVPVSGGLVALVDVGHSRLVAAWTVNGTSWRASPYLRLGAGERLASVGPASGQEVFALVRGVDGGEKLDVAGGPGSLWKELPAPPAATETIAFGSSGTAQALAVHQSVLDVWDLTGGSWRAGQVLHVPIQYGSSS